MSRRCWCRRPVGALSTCGCCCAEHDPIADAKRRHPAGKGIDDLPQTADVFDYLRQKGEL